MRAKLRAGSAFFDGSIVIRVLVYNSLTVVLSFEPLLAVPNDVPRHWLSVDSPAVREARLDIRHPISERARVRIYDKPTRVVLVETGDQLSWNRENQRCSFGNRGHELPKGLWLGMAGLYQETQVSMKCIVPV